MFDPSEAGRYQLTLSFLTLPSSGLMFCPASDRLNTSSRSSVEGRAEIVGKEAEQGSLRTRIERPGLRDK